MYTLAAPSRTSILLLSLPNNLPPIECVLLERNIHKCVLNDRDIGSIWLLFATRAMVLFARAVFGKTIFPGGVLAIFLIWRGGAGYPVIKRRGCSSCRLGV